MSSKSAGATNATRGFLKRYGELVRELPQPGQTWFARDLEMNIDHILNALHANGAIKKAGSVYDEQCNEHINKWRTQRHIYELAHTPEHSRGDSGVLPCGHDAIKNERGVDGITCGVCGTVHDRGEIE